MSTQTRDDKPPTQQPVLHEFPAQQGSPASPHFVAQRPSLEHDAPSEQYEPAQQGWPSLPHPEH
jgi:hypothetical protein